MLPVAFISWFFLVDLVSGGGTWSAIVSIFVGFVLMLVGAGADRAYGFWIHVVAGLAIGGAFLYLWHSADWEWILIGLIALLYFVIAGGFDRSSYAVFGAIGLLLAWSHFVEKWTDTTVEPPILGVPRHPASRPTAVSRTCGAQRSCTRSSGSRSSASASGSSGDSRPSPKLLRRRRKQRPAKAFGPPLREDHFRVSLVERGELRVVLL